MISDRLTIAPALLAAIRAAPDDDAPRLVYADWLDENGQPERAEFIRVQIELARRDDSALRRREADLLAAHRDAFAGPLLAPGLRFRFHRGFIVGFGHTGVFVASRQRQGLDALNDYLRFFPDGTVLDTASTATPREVSWWFHRGHDHSGAGAYSLDAFDFPARIQFTTSEGIVAVDYEGVVQFDSLILEVYSRTTGHRSRREYGHASVKGFDSFEET